MKTVPFKSEQPREDVLRDKPYKDRSNSENLKKTIRTAENNNRCIRTET